MLNRGNISSEALVLLVQSLMELWLVDDSLW